MKIFSRFKDIVEANINALLEKAEDPAKMIDQYLIQATEDLAEVKKETSEVIAEANKAKRALDENTQSLERYTELAKRALTSGNEEDAKAFLAKKKELENTRITLQTSYDLARDNATKMRQLYDKLVDDIETLESRRDAVKSKIALAETQEKVSSLGSSADKFSGTMGAFARMEAKADKMLDMANATAELDAISKDDIATLESKYLTDDTKDVDAELAALKASMGL